MTKFIPLVTTLSVIAGATAHGQGMLSIRPERDIFERKLPLTVTLHGGVGYDSNVNLSSDDPQESIFSEAGAVLNYAMGDRRTSYNVGLEFTGRYLFDAPEGVEDFLYNGRLSFNVRHKVNPRLSISDSAYIAYEFQPNYSIGVGSTRTTDQYLYGYNDVTASYAWTRRLSTVTGYTISGVEFDGNEGNSYISHLIHQEFRYAISRITTLALDYRFGLTTYDSGFGDYRSHYLLAGLDHAFSKRTWGSFRAGAEMRDRDNGGSETAPYVESSISYAAGKDSSFRWYGRLGYEDSSIGTYTRRYSFRTGLSYNQRITNRLSGNASLNYIYDSFDGSSETGSFEDNIIALSLGLDYALYRNVTLTTSYAFTLSESGGQQATGQGRDYDRHVLTLGLRAQF